MKKILIIITFSLLFLLKPFIAEAYVFNGYTLSNPSNVKYAVSTTAGTYTNLISTYAEKWESYCPEIGMSTGSPSNIYFYGELTASNSNYAVTYHANNNNHTITLYAPFNSLDNVKKAETIVHETGHALGLAHCQSSKVNISVMREEGFNNKAYSLADDKAGISAKY